MNPGPPLNCLGSSCEFQFPSAMSKRRRKVSPGLPILSIYMKGLASPVGRPSMTIVACLFGPNLDGSTGVWRAPVTSVCNYTRRARNLDGPQA